MGIDSLGMGTAQRQGLRKNSAFDGKRQKIIQNYVCLAGIGGRGDFFSFLRFRGFSRVWDGIIFWALPLR